MYVVFDIGGTKTRLAYSKDGVDIGEPIIIPTPKDFEEGMAVFEESFKELSRKKLVKAVAGGIRRLDPKKEMLLPDFRLPDWSGKPLKQKLEQMTSVSVYLENDTAMVGLGEAVVGAGKDYRIVVYITISTGVGGARIVDKKLDEKVLGFEPGHQIIDVDWTVYPEVKKLVEEENMGQLEAMISGTSVESRFGKKAYEVDDPQVWDEISKFLAVGLNNTIVHWSPDVIVLGGGMMKSPGISVATVKKSLQGILKIFPNLPEIKKAELGDVGGLHGALMYLKNTR